MSGFGIKFGQAGLYRSYIAKYAIGRQIWQYVLKCLYCVFYSSSIYHQFGLKFADFGNVGEALHIKGEAQTLWVGIYDGDIMVKRQQIAEEGAHLSGSDD
jgi:hypothetical protein